MRHVLLVILAAVLGGLSTAIAIVIAVLILFSGMPDRDGGRSMSIVFGLGPFLAAVTGVLWGVVVHRRMRAGASATPSEAGPGSSSNVTRAVVAWSAGVAGTLALGIAAVNLMTAGGGEDGLVALAVAAVLGAAAWGASRART